MIKLFKYRFLFCVLLVTSTGSRWLSGETRAQNRAIDSLRLALKNVKHDTIRCKIYIKLGIQVSLENPDSAIVFFQKALLLAKNNLPNKGVLKASFLRISGRAIGAIGLNYYYLGNIPKALEFLHKSLKIQEEIGDKSGIAYTLNNLGMTYNGQGDILKALGYHHKSLKIQEAIGDTSGIAISLVNIGIIYSFQNETAKALEYFHKSLKIREEIDDKYGIAASLNGIGSIYYDKGDIDTALMYSQKCYKIQEEIGDKKGMASSLNNIGSIYQNHGDIPKALEYYHKSLKIREEFGDKYGIVMSLNNIGILYEEKGDLKEALIFAQRNMQLAKELGFPHEIKFSANLLKLIFQKQNKYKEAFEMYELEIKMRDSINNQETQKASIKKQMQYTYEKKAQELQYEQDKKDIIAKEELKQKENERNYFIVGFGLVIILALFIFRGYRQKHKANEVITEQKKLVDEKQKEILDSIHYAKRIQTALITSEKYIEKNLNKLNKG